MRYWLFVVSWLCAVGVVYGQNSRGTLQGEVTFVTSQSVYVKFASTDRIAVGDTLFQQVNSQLVPALVVRNTSSTSCVASPLSGLIFEKGMKLIAQTIIVQEPAIAIPTGPVITPETTAVADDVEEESSTATKSKQSSQAKHIKGRLMAASYFDFAEHEGSDRQRMRYTLTLNARQIANTPLSFETYLSFRHTLNEWDEVKENFMRAFKVYSFNLQYALPSSTNITVGRRINPSMSNIGALDGVQLDQTWKRFNAGVFAGSRPDYTDYNINVKLPQFGGYVGHRMETPNGLVQSTLAFAEQRNHGFTDRRFVYLQHLNSAIKHLHVFTSFEFDLYTMRDSVPTHTLDFTSVYFSLRYRVSDKLTLFGSYDARKNIIYYETYKNFIDQLLEDETRQGLRFNVNFRPIKKVMIGTSAGYRFQKDNPRPSTNLHSYLTVSQVPGIRTSATVSAVWIRSPYLDGIIYGLRTGRDFAKGKLYTEIEYRMVSYRYTNLESPLRQTIAGAQLSFRLSKKLSLSCQYEGEFQNANIHHRIYSSIIQRF